jgi:signal transduction histidine kinase
MHPLTKTTKKDYFYSFIITVMAMILDSVLYYLLKGDYHPYLLFISFLFFSVWKFGTNSGILFLIMSSIVKLYILTQRAFESHLIFEAEVFQLALYFLLGFVFVFVIPWQKTFLLQSELKSMQKTLDRTADQLKLALNAADAGTWEWDLRTNTNIWSEALWRLYGLNLFTAVPNYDLWIKTIEPEQRTQIESQLREVVSAGQDLNLEWKVANLLPERWLMSRGKPIFDSDGKLSKYLGIVLDITERKISAEAQYRNLFDSMIEGFCIIEVLFDYKNTAIDYRFLDVNAAFEKQTNIKNARGKRVLELLPENETHWMQSFGQIAMTGEPLHFINESKPLGKWFEVSAYRLGKAESRKVAILFSDITKLKKTEKEFERINHEALARTGELEAILESAPVAIWQAHDNQCLKITGNKYADQMILEVPRGSNISLSYDSPKVTYGVYRKGIELKPEEMPAQVAARTGKPFPHEDLEIRFSDGRSKFLLMGAVPLFDNERKVRGSITTGANVTELKQIEAELRSAVDVRDEFMSIASHELKTPFSALHLQLQFLDLIAKKKSENKEIIKLVDAALKSGMKMGLLLDDLLDVTRIRVGKISIQPELMNLSKAVLECIENIKDEAQLSKVHFHFHGELEIIGKWDPKRISQILINLFSNAIKYGDGKPVDVYLLKNSESRTAQIKVVDYGVGINCDMQSKIFERFQRAGSNGKISGLGLGLYISQKMAKAQGGKITVKSNPGEGSVFTLELPLDKEYDEQLST